MKNFTIFMIITLNLFANDFDKAVEHYNKGSYIQALNIFYLLAKEGDAQAQYNVGMIYMSGKGVKKDIAEAIRWYEKAAKQGNASAQYNFAQFYHASGEKDGYDKSSHFYKKARHWYEKALENGVMQAYNNLASLYMQGKGVEKDEKKAFELFKKAADMGDGSAQVNVGVMYAWGEGITHDKMKAYENFKKALKVGQSEASSHLDRLCKESSWVCQD